MIKVSPSILSADFANLERDMKRLEELLSLLNKAADALDVNDAAASLRRVIEVKEELTVLVRSLAGYFSLRRSADSSDSAGASYQTKISAMIASTTKDNVKFEKFAGSLENLEEVVKYSFYIIE